MESINWRYIISLAESERERLKLTREQLAVKAGVAKHVVSRFETNMRDIQLSSALKILKALGMLAGEQDDG